MTNAYKINKMYVPLIVTLIFTYFFFLDMTTFHEFFQVLVSVNDRILFISLFQCSFLWIIVCPFVPYLLAVVFFLFAVSDYLLTTVCILLVIDIRFEGASIYIETSSK